MCRSWGMTPSLVSGRARMTCAPDQGVPPHPLLGGAPPPSPPAPACHALGAHAAQRVPPLRSPSQGSPPTCPCLHAVLWECMLLGRSKIGLSRVWPPPYPPFLHVVGWECTLLRGCPLLFVLFWGLPPSSFSCMSCSGRARCRSGGSPPSSFLWLCAADARDLFQVSPPAHARVAHAAGAGGPFPFLFLALWWGLRCRFWGSLPNPWLRAMGMCCWASSPPSFPPLGGCMH